MENINHHGPQPGSASMSDVAATLEQVRDEWTKMALELRDWQFDCGSPQSQAVMDKVNEWIAKIQAP